MRHSDEELVRRVRKGDLNAYGTLVERYQGRLTAAAHHLLGDAEAARDVVQETFIEAFRHLDQLRDDARLGAWLYGILRHRAQSWLERRRPTVSWEAEMVEEWYLPEEREERIDLPVLLGRLPAPDREVLAARYLLDLSYEEIAETLGITAVNARVRACRAKERLRALLAHSEEEVGR